MPNPRRGSEMTEYRSMEREQHEHETTPHPNDLRRVDSRDSDGWPNGNLCPVCCDRMDVGAVGNDPIFGETISWQKCENCQLGWGPFSGYVDLEHTGDYSRSDQRPDERVIAEVAARVEGGDSNA